MASLQLKRVYQAPGANAVEIRDAVVAKMDEIRPTLPPGVEIQSIYDTTIFVRDSIKSLVLTLLGATPLVGLDNQASRPARALSGGQQQRLALARAWAMQPDLLLLDEPTASLDPSAKREVEELIEQIADAGVTVVMSTHNLGQAKRLASRVAYLEGARLVVERPVDSFFNDSALPAEAAQFLRAELPWA